MIELTGNLQTVTANAPIVFNNKIVHTGCAEKHRTNSSQINLVCPGRYLITFGANVAIPTGETAGEIDFAISQEGEALDGSIMRTTPTVAGAYFNISTQHYVEVPKCCNNSCCQTVTVKNVGTTSATVSDANITAVRVNG